jgi:hypothetical protein
VADPTQEDESKAEKRRELWEKLPESVRQSPVMRRKFGLGDAVEAVAKPIARALGLPEDCEPCKRRKAHLNALSHNAKARATAFGRRIFQRGTSTK